MGSRTRKVCWSQGGKWEVWGRAGEPERSGTPKAGASREGGRAGRWRVCAAGRSGARSSVRLWPQAQAPPRVSSEAAISAAACKINVIGIMLQFDLSTGFN